MVRQEDLDLLVGKTIQHIAVVRNGSIQIVFSDRTCVGLSLEFPEADLFISLPENIPRKE